MSLCSKNPALANKHLIVKERPKLIRAGACDRTTNTSLMGDSIYVRLNDDCIFFGQWESALMESGAPSFTTTSHGKEEAMTKNSLRPVLRRKHVQTKHVLPSTHRNNPISHFYLAKRQTKTTILLRPFLHMPHSTRIRIPGYWACNLQCNCNSHAGC